VKSCSSEFKKLSLDLKFWANDVMIGVCFAVLLMASSVNPMSQFRGSKFYWILGYSTSLWSPWSTF